MAVIPIASGAVAYTSNSNQRVLDRPASTQVGDVFHIQLAGRASFNVSQAHGAVTVFAGETTSGSGYFTTLLWVSDVGGAGTTTFTLSASVAGSIAWEQFRGVDPTNPLVGSASVYNDFPDWIAPAFSTTEGGYRVGGFCVSSGSAPIEPSSDGWTKTLQAADRIGLIAKGGPVDAGEHPPVRFVRTDDPGWYARAVAYQFVLREAPATPGPDVSFTSSAVAGIAPLTVNFASTSTGNNITSHVWEFGDGSTGPNSANVSHTYTEPGVYTVLLHVSDADGTSTAFRTITVNAVGPTPVVNTGSLNSNRWSTPSTRVVFDTGVSYGAVLPTSQGHVIYPDLGDLSAYGPLVDFRSTSRVDVRLSGGQLGVLSSHASASHFTVFDPSNNYATIVHQASVPLTTPNPDASPICLHRSDNGHWWATVSANSQVLVSRSTDGGITWGAPEQLFTTPMPTGKAAFAQVGTDVLLVAMNNDGGGRWVRRIPQNSGSYAAGAWSSETLPAYPTGVVSDDHLSITSGDDGTVYVGTKTTGSISSDTPVLMVLTRDPNGTWTDSILEYGPESNPFYTRPSLSYLGGESLMAGYGTSQSVVNYRASHDSGSSWSARGTLSEGGDLSDSVMLPMVIRGGTYPTVVHVRNSGAIRIEWHEPESPPAPSPVGSGVSEGPSDTVSASIVVPSGAGALIAAVAFNNDGYQTVSSVTANGSPLTLVAAEQTDDDGRIEWWWKPEPEDGATGVTATLTAGLNSEDQALVLGAWALEGVDEIRDFSFGWTQEAVASVSTSVSTEPGDVVLVCGFSEDGAAYGATFDPPVTTDWQEDGEADRAAGGRILADGTDASVAWSIGGLDVLIVGALTVGPTIPGPTVDFTADVVYGPAPLTVNFTSTSTGNNITALSWNFGDGPPNNENLVEVPKTYADPGVYTVSLTVTDDDGTNTRTKVDYILVTPGSDVDPPPVTEELPPSGPVRVNAETQVRANASADDWADDPAIYYDAANPSASVVIGAFKHPNGGLAVYDLAGNELSWLQIGPCNNVDLRDGVFGGRVLLLTTERTTNTLRYVWLDRATKTLSTAGSTSVGFEPYGCCLYVSPVNGDVYAFVTNRNSPWDFDQYRLSVSGDTVSGTKVRDLSTSSLSEGLVADDYAGYVFLGEEDVGLFRYSAEPTGGGSRFTIDTTGSGGHLTADVEGLAIARSANANYLIASSQGDSTFQVYDLAPPHAWRKEFWLTSGPGGEPDAVTDTDGMEVLWRNLGPQYPNGIIVAHDNANTGGTVSNFKYADLGLALGAIGGSGPDPTSPWSVLDAGGLTPVIPFGAVLADGFHRSGDVFLYGEPSTPPPVFPPGDEWPTDVTVDHGRDLKTWMDQPGGQVLVLPPGQYTMSNPDGISKQDMLWLVAKEPGTVVVNSTTNGVNIEGVGFAGIHFARSQRIATATTGVDTGRLVFWYCEFTNDDAFHTTLHSTALTLFHRIRGPVYVMGSFIHNAQHDGIKANPGGATLNGFVHIQGCRIWDLHGYPGQDYHCDAIQSEQGKVTVWDTVCGLSPDGTPSGNGHIMMDNIGGTQGAFIDFRRLWVTQSGPPAIHWHRKQETAPMEVYARDINYWNNSESGLYIAGGPVIDQANVVEAAPTGPAPDVVWRQANSYTSLLTWAATHAPLL